MMKWRLYILLFGMLTVCSAQDREAAIWHFGQFAGLDFNSLQPQNINNGRLNTITGCSAISNEDGELRLYSDGIEAFSGAHNFISPSVEMRGSQLSTQSALIVPWPERESTYFIFTVSSIVQANRVLAEGDGLNYYVANTNGIGGSVSPTRQHLVTYNPENRVQRLLKCSEKLTAIKHPDQDRYWVVTHFEDSFYAFSVDVRGVAESPVITQIGPYQHLGGYRLNSKGQIKISPDGTKLAMANYQNSVDSEGNSPGSLYIFDFDVNSGRLSNAQELMADDFVFGYGVEFSPNSKKLYTSAASNRYGEIPRSPPPLQGALGSSVFQIDLENNFVATRLFGDDNEPTALQQAIDGKIYKAHEGRRELGVVHNPNADRQDVMYDDVGLLISAPSQRGLPGFVQSFFQVRVEFEEACEGFETKLSTNYLPEPDNIAWNFGDGSPTLNTTDKFPTHIYPNGGTYTVSATITKGTEVNTYSKAVIVRGLPEARPAFITQCDDDSDGIASFNLIEAAGRINGGPGTQYTFFLDQSDAENDINPISREDSRGFSNSTASRVYVRVTSEFGCFRVTTLDLSVTANAIPPDLFLEYSTCDADVDGGDQDGIGIFDLTQAIEDINAIIPGNDSLAVNFYESFEDAVLEVRSVNPTNFRNDDSPFSQQLWIRVESADRSTCIGIGQHISLSVNPVPEFELLANETICSKQLPYTIGSRDAPEEYFYEWTDADGQVVGNGQEIPINEAGIYTVTATKVDGTFCQKSKSIEITTVTPPVITNVDVEGIIALRSTATVSTETEGEFEYALDNDAGPFQSSNIFYEVAPGIHRVFVRDKSNCELDSMEFSVIGHPAFFTPNNDGVNDYWQLQGVSESLQSESLIHIYDRYGVLLAQVDPTSLGWDGMTEGQMLPASDYWFRVKLEDGREFSGHFALKR